MRSLRLFLLPLLAGCGGTATGPDGGHQHDLARPAADFAQSAADLAAPGGDLANPGGDLAGTPDLAVRTDGGAACMPTSSTNLPGVTIRLRPASCRFTLAQALAGIAVAYDIVVDGDVSGVIAEAQDAGRCDRPGPSALIPLARLTGNGQSYCICDSGRCLPPAANPVTLKKGVYPGSFQWDGLNWGGPSDTGQPKGKPFPAGSYDLAITAVGKLRAGGVDNPFEVRGGVTLTLTP